MNKVILSGNLVKDMEVIPMKDLVVGKFVIANNRGYGDNKRTSFIQCTIFGEKRVKALEEYLVKGVGVVLDGELDITSKEEKDGWKTYTTVIVDNLDITKFKNEEEEKPRKRKR